MAFACESDFRNYLVELITRARMKLFKELPARSLGENRRGALRCDIAIPRPSAAGVVAIIECKVETDPQSLFTALGQAQIYRRAFGADHAIVCFPLSARLPTMFLDEFQERGVTVAFGREILGALAELGLIEEPVAANHMLTDWGLGVRTSASGASRIWRRGASGSVCSARCASASARHARA